MIEAQLQTIFCAETYIAIWVAGFRTFFYPLTGFFDALRWKSRVSKTGQLFKLKNAHFPRHVTWFT